MEIYDLQKIENIREILPREDSDFTPWIADNLYKINNQLGLDLELLEQEAICGKYRLDIKAKDTSDDSIAIIENQYGYTDHDHLGKLLTYASGFEAKHIIWITEEYNDEHRSAIDWLNEISHEDISFFLLQVELVKINNSDIASNFKVICKPNDWSKTLKDKIKGQYSEKGEFLINYWSNLKEYAKDNNYKFINNLRKPSAKTWSILSISTPLAHLSMNSVQNKVFVNFYINEDKELFNYLFENKHEIESKLNNKNIIWDYSEGKKKSEILIENKNFNYKSQNQEDVYKWLLDTLDDMNNVFPEYINNYKKLFENV
jgi:hypothetical protein